MDYLYVEKGQVIETVEFCNQILVRYNSGINSENYTIIKPSGHKLVFAIIKLNDVYYISINNKHVVDYKKFSNIKSIISINDVVCIENTSVGKIMIEECSLDLVQCMMEIIHTFVKSKIGLMYHIKYFVNRYM